MANFATIPELKSWLTAHRIDITRWAAGGAKSVENLWSEIIAGETELQDDPPLRLVRLVKVIIRQEDKILVEVNQEFGENQQRYRGLPPAEKIKPYETPSEAALRCLQEELQVEPDQVQLGAVSEARARISDSQSYPGLPTRYLTYEVEAQVTGLPNGDFWTTEAEHADGDPVRNHHWQWMSREAYFQARQ